MIARARSARHQSDEGELPGAGASAVLRAAIGRLSNAKRSRGQNRLFRDRQPRRLQRYSDARRHPRRFLGRRGLKVVDFCVFAFLRTRLAASHLAKVVWDTVRKTLGLRFCVHAPFLRTAIAAPSHEGWRLSGSYWSIRITEYDRLVSVHHFSDRARDETLAPLGKAACAGQLVRTSKLLICERREQFRLTRHPPPYPAFAAPVARTRSP